MAATFSIQLPFSSSSYPSSSSTSTSRIALLPTPPRQRRRGPTFRVRAAKPPAGVEMPKEQPKFEAPFAGFTTTAEIWNSRACMIGILGVFIVELILDKGVLQVIGLEVGKGLNLPL